MILFLIVVGLIEPAEYNTGREVNLLHQSIDRYLGIMDRGLLEAHSPYSASSE